MHPRPFLRTSSSTQLIPSYECPKGAPQYVVIGFNLGEDGNKTSCERPPCVREPWAHCNSVHLEHARSPRSVLGSLLATQKVEAFPKEGNGLGGMGAEGKQALLTSSFLHGRSKPTEITEKVEAVCSHRNGALAGGILVDSGGSYTDDLDLDEDYEESIFCAASPFSTCCSLDLSCSDFLSVCFFCKSCLADGKDLYMYKGDEAFCSAECRYQQIVKDEFKERQTAAASCFMGAAKRSSKMFAGASTAVA